MKQRSWIGLLAASSIMIAPEGARAEEPPPLSGIVMQVDALTTNNGLVYCDLYDKKEGFPTDPKRALARVKVRPNRNQVTCVFLNIKAGRYAVAVWHDVNGDQKFNTNWLWIPSEPVGASNNAKGSFGPPSFKDAAFEYRPPLLKQTIRLD